MSDEPEPIRFTANVVKVQTMVDGGIRLTLDLLPPTTDEAVMSLMNYRRPGIILECAAIAIDIETIKKEEGFSL